MVMYQLLILSFMCLKQLIFICVVLFKLILLYDFFVCCMIVIFMYFYMYVYFDQRLDFEFYGVIYLVEVL